MKNYIKRIIQRLAIQFSRPLHVDYYIFSSTYYGLDALNERIIKDALIQFDEIYNLFRWRNYEYKAQNNLYFNYIGFTDRRILVKIRSYFL